MADMDISDAVPAKIDDLTFLSKDGNDEPLNTIERPDTKNS